MKFCTKCGADLAGRTKFCGRCGAPVVSFASEAVTVPAARRQPILPAVPEPMPRTIVMLPQKSSGVAIVLSFFWCGLGQLYTGQIFKGVLMMIVYPALLVFGYLTFVIGFIVAAGSPKPDEAAAGGGAALLGFLCLIVAAVIWVYGLVNAYRTAERYNRERLTQAHEF
jgi:TM2 domain-containing membrane protein YozV